MRTTQQSGIGALRSGKTWLDLAGGLAAKWGGNGRGGGPLYLAGVLAGGEDAAGVAAVGRADGAVVGVGAPTGKEWQMTRP